MKQTIATNLAIFRDKKRLSIAAIYLLCYYPGFIERKNDKSIGGLSNYHYANCFDKRCPRTDEVEISLS